MLFERANRGLDLIAGAVSEARSMCMGGASVGGLFQFECPDGTGLMSNAVFGCIARAGAGRSAADPGR